MGKYVIGIDQSTQGTKAILFDQKGQIIGREDRIHKQIISNQGWVSHDLMEIYRNTIYVVKNVIQRTKVAPEDIVCVGISNQRETSALWNRITGEPLADAVVWQCARAADICRRPEIATQKEMIQSHTGLRLSAYFPAAKMTWLSETYLKNTNTFAKPDKCEHLRESEDAVCFGTIDSWLIFKLTHGRSYKTDYSNASRTQLFNIHTLQWDTEICGLFGISEQNLPEVCNSNDCFGYTDFEGVLPHEIPIHSAIGDSHAALFGQGCMNKGNVKATYGTGSSVMMNIGEEPKLGEKLGKHGVVTSLGWGIDGKVTYVCEGNINYTGAVVTWLKDDVHMIDSASETEILAESAVKNDSLYFIPAFTGLGAPYWDSNARASFIGISRNTGRAELVRAALESIAYQITDVIHAMEQDTGIKVQELHVDGGPSRNAYLMQFQSDMAQTRVDVPEVEELSGIGAAYMAGIAIGIYPDNIMEQVQKMSYHQKMNQDMRDKKYQGWLNAVGAVRNQSHTTID